MNRIVYTKNVLTCIVSFTFTLNTPNDISLYIEYYHHNYVFLHRTKDNKDTAPQYLELCEPKLSIHSYRNDMKTRNCIPHKLRDPPYT